MKFLPNYVTSGFLILNLAVLWVCASVKMFEQNEQRRVVTVSLEELQPACFKQIDWNVNKFWYGPLMRTEGCCFSLQVCGEKCLSWLSFHSWVHSRLICEAFHRVTALVCTLKMYFKAKIAVGFKSNSITACFSCGLSCSLSSVTFIKTLKWAVHVYIWSNTCTVWCRPTFQHAKKHQQIVGVENN